MKAFVIHGPGDARVETVPDPTPKPGQVVIEPIVSGLCATDVHIFYDGILVKDLPIIMGHETSGRVVAIGPDAQTWSQYSGEDRPLEVGDTVVCEPMIPCGTCSQCLRGRQNICMNLSHLGIWEDGCWADYVAVPAMRAVRVPEGLPPEQAVLVEPLACGLHFVDRSGISSGQSILIVGAGPAGLLTMQAAKAAGANPVMVSDPAPVRREAARRLGADIVIDPTADDVAGVVMEATKGLGADAIIEVAGAQPAVRQAMDLARIGSTVVLAGVCGEETTPIDTNSIVTRELNVVGALASRWHFGRAFNLVASGDIDVASLVSRRAPWTDVPDELVTAREDQSVVKILLDH